MVVSTSCTASQAQAAFLPEDSASDNRSCQPAGIVLLKNRDGSSGQPRLPLQAKALRKIVILRPHMHSPENLLGDYYSNAAGHITTPYEAIQVRLHSCTRLVPQHSTMHCTKAGMLPERETLLCVHYSHASWPITTPQEAVMVRLLYHKLMSQLQVDAHPRPHRMP